jgi:hypothetical protein
MTWNATSSRVPVAKAFLAASEVSDSLSRNLFLCDLYFMLSVRWLESIWGIFSSRLRFMALTADDFATLQVQHAIFHDLPKQTLRGPAVEPTLSEAVTPLDDPKSSWTERRISHQNLANGFLLALLIDRNERPNTLDRPEA